MSMEADIKAALVSLAYPCAANIYEGTASTYFVFNYTIIPSNFADDEPQHDKYLVMVHFYAPHTLNTVTIRKSIRSLIQTAFMRPTEMPAHDELKQHYVYEFEVTDGTD
jgi:hypothetical protein